VRCAVAVAVAVAVAYTVVEGFEGYAGMQLIRTDSGGEVRTLVRSR
jgi:hypothetical protein